MGRHRDPKLDSMLGCRVRIDFKDGKVMRGILGYADDFNEKHDYRKPFCYYIDNLSFRKTHVRKIMKLLY